MGKRLIIKGANFTDVAVDKEIVTRWVYDNIDWTQTGHRINSNGMYACGVCIGQYDWNAVAGKKIIGIKLHITAANRGTLQFVVIRNFRQSAVEDGIEQSYGDNYEVQTISVTETGVQTFMLPTPVVLTGNDWVGVGNFESGTNMPGMYLDETKNAIFVRSQYYQNPNTYDDYSSYPDYAPPCLDLLYEVE